MEKAIELDKDLSLITSVNVDYTLGRRRGYTDKETEIRANEAFGKVSSLITTVASTQESKLKHKKLSKTLVGEMHSIFGDIVHVFEVRDGHGKLIETLWME